MTANRRNEIEPEAKPIAVVPSNRENRTNSFRSTICANHQTRFATSTGMAHAIHNSGVTNPMMNRMLSLCCLFALSSASLALVAGCANGKSSESRISPTTRTADANADDPVVPPPTTAPKNLRRACRRNRSPAAAIRSRPRRRAVLKVTQMVFPAVVRLDVAQEIYTEGKRNLRRGIGSGVIIDEQGHILTNYHVAGRAAEILRHALQQRTRPRKTHRRRSLDRPGRP